jgi:uncharacterized protein (TIGR00369 family)
MAEKLARERSARYDAIERRAREIPIFDTLGLKDMELGEGTCRVRISRDTRYDGIYESLHGGILMTLADSAAAFAVLTLVDPDEPITTTDMNIRFFAPARSDVVAEAKVLKLGRTLVPLSVDLTDAGGTRVALAQVTYMRLGVR